MAGMGGRQLGLQRLLAALARPVPPVPPSARQDLWAPARLTVHADTQRSAARGTNERDDPRLADLPRNRLALHVVAAHGTPRLGHRIVLDAAIALHKKTSAGDPRIHTGGTWGNARNDR